MNLIYFIRLLLKNVILIGGVAVFMAVLVFLKTRNQERTYSSEMVIYTGLATGYDIESGTDTRFDLFGTNARFDNLINIIKSRQTQEETAIRLMTQHLMLEQPDPRFCKRETWDAIQGEAPREVKSLIQYSDNALAMQGYIMPKKDNPESPSQSKRKISKRKKGQKNTEPEYTIEQKTRMVPVKTSRTEWVTEQKEKFDSKPKFYTVKAGDYPLGIAKKFGLSLAQLEELNSPADFPIHGGQIIRVGLGNESYLVDTLVERFVEVDSLIEEVFMDTVWKDSFLISERPDYADVAEPMIDPIVQMDSISENFEYIYDEALSAVQAYENNVENLIRYKKQNQNNYIYTTLQSSNPVYGIGKISKIRVSRMQNSDLLKLSYESHDPGVCQQTLLIITEVFKKQFQSIKGAQTSMVSDYFRRQRDRAKVRLDSLEEFNKQYRMEHRIINYNEQTKFIAEQNEVLDRDWYDESATLSAAKAALYSLEAEMDEYSRNLVQRAEIMDLRERLARLTRLLNYEEVSTNPDIELMAQYRNEREDVQKQMNAFMANAFQSKRSPEGIDMSTVLGRWLDKVIAVEESRAKYEVKTAQKNEFMGKYDKFAPLGSTLTKIEREIGLAEQEYLNQTHSLDLSLMKQKNNEQSNIRIIDEPIYPIKPNASKRMFTVIAAFMAGLILTATTLILLEFIDTSIKFPERAEELTGSKLIGAYPKIPASPNQVIDYGQITSRLVDMTSQKIKLAELQRPAVDKPFVILMLSTRKNEGKSFIANRLVEKFRAVGHRVLYIKPFEELDEDRVEDQFRMARMDVQSWDFEYEVPDNFMRIKNVNELLRNYTFLTREYQYIFIELPALLSSEYPTDLVSNSDLALLVCRATRTWNKADDEVLALFKNNFSHSIFSFLNGVQVDNLEGIVGEIPRRRSLIRILIKKVLNFDFKFARSF